MANFQIFFQDLNNKQNFPDLKIDSCLQLATSLQKKYSLEEIAQSCF